MLTKKYFSEVVGLSNPADGLYTVSFQSHGKPFKFRPGQFLHLSIDSEYDGVGQWPESRCFSMQNSPGGQLVKITYAVKGSYTKLMEQQLSIGRKVWIKMPYGDLFQQTHDKANNVFIAGGTGITPFLSLFTHESFNEYVNPKIYLGFRSKSHNIYQDEIERIEKICKIRAKSCNSSQTVKLVYEDEVGILNISEIFYENSVDSIYFITGPPAMIKSFKQILIAKGVAIGNVLTDDWE